ncbi:acetate--CoA ligase family protein [Neobacillus sp. 179-C4.2 HS]|uniref:Acetate--CoA ligase family protein n=1 Tax=Neobacillus driksii TaxID=3035913 RepID=A0ABV4YRT5_9BACI|nr:acetate--CoA ligase family protein [Neobacillus sp. 179.-C4.2 HS]MDP5195128.1 acetate--CoA ligase family protein [Neobacillus sp. 179.-C4.2 HS]
MKRTNLRALFDPESIAIIGASPDDQKIGGRPLSYLQKYRYEGKIYPINPKYKEINDLKCFPDIKSVPEEIDLAIIAVPKSIVLETFKKCADRKVRSVVIFSAGFAEVDEEGKRLQEEISLIAEQNNVSVLGPNCLGMFNVKKSVYGTFSTIIEDEKPLLSNIGFVSQSGAFGSHVFTLARQHKIGFSYFVATGNECDVDVADCIQFLAEDPGTDVIACYIEGTKDGDKLIEALKLARKNKKPVIALKVGKTDVGMKAALSHTGSLVGSDDVFDTVFKQNGVYRAETIEEFLDVTYAASKLPFPKGNRTAVFTVSGGVGIMLADQLSANGLTLPETPEPVKEKLRDILPIAAVQNPIDTTAQISYMPTLLEDFMESVLSSGEYDSAVVFLGFAGLKLDSLNDRIETLVKMKDRFKDIPQIAVTINSETSRQIFSDAGLYVSDDPSRAVTVSKALLYFAGQQEEENEEVYLPNKDIFGLSTVLTEYGSKKILKQYGIPITEEKLARTAEEAVQYANEIGYPIVLKGMSPQILHKTEKGLVILNVKDNEEVREKFGILKTIIQQTNGAEFEGVLIQEMLKNDSVEMVVGSKKDPIFGQIVLVGLGGIYIEVLKDVSMRKAPVSVREAEKMIHELRASPILHSYRGKQPYDVEELSKLISQFSHFIVSQEEKLLEVDLNPVMVFTKGQGIKVADGLMTLEKQVIHS